MVASKALAAKTTFPASIGDYSVLAGMLRPDGSHVPRPKAFTKAAFLIC